MTIASADKEIGALVAKHHVYGAEALINALVRACATERWLEEADIHRMVASAFQRFNDKD